MRSSNAVILALAIGASPTLGQAPRVLDAHLAPDGTQIAVRVADDGGTPLFVLPVGDSLSDANAITPRDAHVSTYAWTPDGGHLVYRSQKDGHLYLAPSSPGRVRDLTPDATGPVRLVGFGEEGAAALIEVPGRWVDAPDLYRVVLATGERTPVEVNKGGVREWIVGERGEPRLAVRVGDDGSTELARVREGDIVPVYTCPPKETCEVIGFRPDGRAWLRTVGPGVGTGALSVLDPLTGEVEVARPDLSGDSQAAFTSDSLYRRDVARLRQQLGDAILTFQPPVGNGARMLVTARDSAGAAIYLFDRWAGSATRLFTVDDVEADRSALLAAAVSEPAPVPSPELLREVRLRYRVTDNDIATPTTEFDRRINHRSSQGREEWRVVDAGEVPTYEAIPLDTTALPAEPPSEVEFDEPPEPEGFTEAADTVIVDASSFAPLARRTGGPVTARLDFSGGRVTGEVGTNGFVTNVDLTTEAQLWADGPALELLVAALPLAAGYATQLTLFDGGAVDTMTVRLEVAGTERVATEAGDFDTWRLTITPVSGEGATYEWLVMQAPPHYLIRGTLRSDDYVQTTVITKAGDLR